MKKIQIFALEFGYGGIEREMVTLANSLVNVFNIELIFVRKNYGVIPYNLNNKVKLTFISEEININGSIRGINDFKLSKYLKNKINADTVISTNSYFNKYINSSSVQNKIYWEHNHHDNIDIIFDEVINTTKNFNTIVVPNKTLEKYYKENSKIDIKLIPTLIDLNGDKLSNLNNKVLVSVGKLKQEKGFQELINVMELVHAKDKSIKLHIIGEGPYRKKLEEMVKEKKLTHTVSFYGVLEKEEVIEAYLNSGLFVMCSEHEAFCISLIEAMTVGLPAVLYYENSLDGIINNDINGYMVKNNDKEVMADKILEYLNNPNILKNLGVCAKETVMFYDVNTLKGEWIKIL